MEFLFSQNQSSNDRRRQSGMLRPVFLWWCVSLLCCHLSMSAATEEEAPPATAQEALGLLASLQQASEGSNNELRKMAGMYELLQLAALQQQQRQRLAELEEGMGEGEELPVPLPLQGRLPHLAFQDKDEFIKDKRGSYMSLCHFKICNMGRKRNSYAWSSWGRN
uniref:Somatostatin/Cortistatin C-terminal domain-containing protein n=1 Tax=Cuerna arida TaxID=1464854 RepID=A0A1B6GUY6_9HEMI